MPPRGIRTSRPSFTEFGLIRTLKQRFGRTDRSVIRGIDEDAAVLRPSPQELILVTTDLLAEGIHFDLTTSSFANVGYRGAIANLSDIASMGGTPRFLLVALAIPPDRSKADIESMYKGMMQACRAYEVQLVGGDTSASRRGLFLSIVLIGSARAGRILPRNGAKVGDRLYVTGTLGDSLAGFRLLMSRRARAQGGRRTPTAPQERYLIRRHLHPLARITEARWLANRKIASAAIDLSDGLAGDLRHLCEQSRVGAEIEASSLPVSHACRTYAGRQGLNPTELALTGGEDYELLFTVPAHQVRRFERLKSASRLMMTCIGTIKPKRFGIKIRSDRGSLRKLGTRSYEHFRTPEPLEVCR